MRDPDGSVPVRLETGPAAAPSASSCARSASPLATEVSSSPERIRSSPKRAANSARTAGTSDEPPVRKTRSTSPRAIPQSASSPSTHFSMAASSGAIQVSNSVAGRGRGELHRAVREGELAGRAAGQRELGALHRAV